jgi:holliday junction DNA helicase RuvB
MMNQVTNELRPKTLKDYIGQKSSKQLLDVAIRASKVSNKPIDHVLVFGNPGLGKTSIAQAVANEMNVAIKIVSGMNLSKPEEMLSVLIGIKENSVLFIDEVHNLSRRVEEVLYAAMEDGKIDLLVGEGSNAKVAAFTLPKFTLIGATTRVDLLNQPFRDRFGLTLHLQFYTIDELVSIIERSAKIMKMQITREGAEAIATRSRGTARIANQLLKRARDFAIVENSAIDTRITDLTFDLLKIDSEGLGEIDHKVLTALRTQFKGKSVGLDVLAATVGENSSTIAEYVEPFLLNKGLITRTGKGRQAV